MNSYLNNFRILQINYPLLLLKLRNIKGIQYSSISEALGRLAGSTCLVGNNLYQSIQISLLVDKPVVDCLTDSSRPMNNLWVMVYKNPKISMCYKIQVVYILTWVIPCQTKPKKHNYYQVVYEDNVAMIWNQSQKNRIVSLHQEVQYSPNGSSKRNRRSDFS